MSWLDAVIVLVIVISGLIGLTRGFVKEAVSVITWVAAIWLAVLFSGEVAAMLPQSLEHAAFSLGGTDFEIRNIRIGIAFVLLVVATLIAGVVVNMLLAKITSARVVKGADRLLVGPPTPYSTVVEAAATPYHTCKPTASSVRGTS